MCTTYMLDMEKGVQFLPGQLPCTYTKQQTVCSTGATIFRFDVLFYCTCRQQNQHGCYSRTLLYAVLAAIVDVVVRFEVLFLLEAEEEPSDHEHLN